MTGKTQQKGLDWNKEKN